MVLAAVKDHKEWNDAKIERRPILYLYEGCSFFSRQYTSEFLTKDVSPGQFSKGSWYFEYEAKLTSQPETGK